MNCTKLLHLKPQLTIPHLSFPNPYPKINQFRPYKRRRLKLCCINNNGSSCNILDALNSFFSQFPSPNSLQILTPVLALVPGLTLYLSQSKSKATSKSVGEWILFTSPTPFNRFLILRCPSISLEGSEFLENVNEKLVQEDRHFVRLNKGRIHGVTSSESFEFVGKKLVYQRVCVNTEDGGVISIDWPANLELEEEYGLDTTLFLVPGTPKGSMEENVRGFVVDALKRGFFPVVMNPRGCAGSPVTTARLFTAADSDDICTAIQFISKARPWTTLMGVGWGYGANMLTKYLAEVGDSTPLTAATCINNPFDLEEATRCSPSHVALDQELTGGLIDILQSNKAMFQGRAKGFDVEKALLSKSVRDFEEAISMVSYGFEEIGDFYSKSSTRDMVGNVKIPVLFIQSDDGTVPLFSIPRSLIAKNPFTSLLLCSCVPSSVVESGRAAVSWCQNLTIEWLTSVELGLLKGRHPLLKDVDVNINPSKGLTLVEGQASDKRVRLNKLSGLTLTDANGYIEPLNKIIQDRNNAIGLQSRSEDLHGNLELKGLQEGQNSAFRQRSPVHTELVEQDSSDPGDTEKGQVLQTAKVVMNMLDVTMPGTLSEEEREKVLIAVDQGETVMKALQDAVPEEVRGKLTTAVSGILHAPHPNLKIDGLLGISKIPNESKTKIPEVSEVSSAEGASRDPHSPDQMKTSDNFTDGSGNNESAAEKSGAGLEPELCASKNTEKSTNASQSQAMSCKQGDSSGSVRKEPNETENKNESDEFIKGKAASFSNSSDKALETSDNPNLSSRAENAGGTEEAIVDKSKVDQDGGIHQLETKREGNTQKIEEKTADASADQSTMVSANTTEETLSRAGSSLDSQPVETEGSDDQKRENKVMQPAPDQHKHAAPVSNPATFNVAQALDALTGMDDSTQVAVNSVFGVIENMISELEEKDSETKFKDENEVENESADSKPNKLESTNDVTLQSDTLQHPPAPMLHENNDNLQNAASIGWLEGQPTENFLVSETGTSGSQGNNASNYQINEKQKKDQLVGAQLLADNRHVNSIPLYISANPYGDFLQNEYFRRYLLSKLPNTKPLDLNTTTALLLDYFPEEGQWKLLEQPGTVGESVEGVITDDSADVKFQGHSSRKVDDGENYVEPSYVLLDTENKPVEEYSTVDDVNQVENGDDRSDYLQQFVKAVILDTLRTEVGRKLGSGNRKEMKSKLGTELEQVADAVSLAVGRNKDRTWSLKGNYQSIEGTEEKVGTIQGEHVVKAISSAVLRTHYLRRFLPVGLVVGSSLAALRRYFKVATRSEDGLKSPDQTKKHGQKIQDRVSTKEIDHKPTINTGDMASFNSSRSIEVEEAALKIINNDSVVVGAFTAALGASALLAQQQYQSNIMESEESPSKSLKERRNNQKVANKLDEDESEKSQNNMVTNLAEKALSVAGPVVPTKEDGEVDQDRLVAMLADLGQKGGILKLVGKVALLWAGIRGAMSLTDRLILFLRIAQRPLYQRVLGFAGMVLVLWSPVVIPFLPMLVQSWTTSNPSRLAELVCIFGLYISVMILLILWGRRIRGYEDPLEQYGLDLTTFPKFQCFLRGLVGGVMLVVFIQSINGLLGCVSFSWPSSLSSSSSNAISWLKVYGQVIMLAGRIITATGVVLVEELLFRSWLPDEIAADLGYHRGIIISGLVFSLFQRSLWAVPGLWLFSLALTGFRQRSQGGLSFPIGLRTGITASSFVLQTGGFITYNPNYPVWLTGTHPLQPFSGVIGLAVSFLLAIMLYPRQPLQKKK